MKTRNEFFEDFFARLRQEGFRVHLYDEGDLVAEVFVGSVVFCVITHDGEIIYLNYDADKSETLEYCADETRTALCCCTINPYESSQQMDLIGLASGPYVMVSESKNALLLYHETRMFGFEFATCLKATAEHNNLCYYREQLYYDPIIAQDSFMERSGLIPNTPLSLTHEELRILVSCCAKCVMLDNELDGSTQSQINMLMARIEGYLPPQEHFEPQYYNEEHSR